MIEQQRIADASAAAAVAIASTTWIAQLNEILQLVATCVAIVAGGAAAYYHITKARGNYQG